MDQAAKISNKAIGKQDVYLLSDSVQDSPFIPTSEMHSKFIKYHRSRNVVKPTNVSGWPFGKKVNVEFKPRNMGDLLSNMWLSITLPKLETDYRNDVTVTTVTEKDVYEVTTDIVTDITRTETVLTSNVVPPFGTYPGVVYSKIINDTGTISVARDPVIVSDTYIRTETTSSVENFSTFNQSQTYENSTGTTSTSDTETTTTTVTNPFQTTTTEATTSEAIESNSTLPSSITIETLNQPPSGIFFDDALDLEPYSSINNVFGQNMVVSPTGYRYFIPNYTDRVCNVYGVNDTQTGVAKEVVLKIYKENGLSNGEKFRLATNGFGDVLLVSRRYKIGVNYIQVGTNWEPRIVSPPKTNEILVNSFDFFTREWTDEPISLQPDATTEPYLDLGYGVAISSDGLTVALGTIFCGGYDSNNNYTPFMSHSTNGNNVVIFKYSGGVWTQHSTIQILGSGTSTGLYYFKPTLNKDATRLAVSYYKIVPTNTSTSPTQFTYNSPTVTDTYLKVYDYDSGTDSWVEDTTINSVIPTSTRRSNGDFFGMFISMDSTGNSIAVGAPYYSFSTTNSLHPYNTLVYTNYGWIHYFRKGTINTNTHLFESGSWTYEPLVNLYYDYDNGIFFDGANSSKYLGANIVICGRGLYSLSSSNNDSTMLIDFNIDEAEWELAVVNPTYLSDTTSVIYSYKDQSSATDIFVGDNSIVYVSKYIFNPVSQTYQSRKFEIDNTISFGDTISTREETFDIVGNQTSTESIVNERYETTVNITHEINNVALTTNYADQVGRHIFKSITMYVDEIEVEKIYDDWTIIHDEQYLEFSEKITNAYLVNRNLGFDNATLSQFSELANYETELMIPIPFFFSRKYTGDEYKLNEPNKPFFPLASIYKQNITFEIEFHKQSFFTDTLQTIKLDSFDIITEEITVSDSERLFMMKESNEIVTEFVKRHPSTTSTIGDIFVTNNLSPIIPVKTFHWFFRREEFENDEVSRQPSVTNQEEYYYQNRFNFSTSPTYSVTTSFFDPVMKKGFLYLLGNRVPNITDATSNYYKYKVPSDVRLSIPSRNIYTYSFAIRPMNTQPSGVLDFATIQSDKTRIEMEIVDASNTYSMHMYYTGYQTMRFQDGFMSFV